MGMFDDLLGKAGQQDAGAGQNPLAGMLGGLFGGNQQQGGNMIGLVLGLVQQMGGISAVLNLFRQHGLRSQADSWVSNDENQSITGDDVQQVFGASRIQEVANQAGIPEDQARSGIARVLPELMNRLTPGGKVPENQDDVLSKAMSGLRGFMQ